MPVMMTVVSAAAPLGRPRHELRFERWETHLHEHANRVELDGNSLYSFRGDPSKARQESTVVLRVPPPDPNADPNPYFSKLGKNLPSFKECVRLNKLNGITEASEPGWASQFC